MVQKVVVVVVVLLKYHTYTFAYKIILKWPNKVGPITFQIFKHTSQARKKTLRLAQPK